MRVHPRHFHIVLTALDKLHGQNDHLSAKHLKMLCDFFPPQYRNMFHEKIIDCTRLLCRNYRETKCLLLASKIIIKFKLHGYFENKELLLPLIRMRKHLNLVFEYVTSAPSEMLDRLQFYSLRCIADPKGGNAPTKAYQKIQEWSLGVTNFPKIIYFRRQAALQWLIKINRHMEFVDFIADDEKLLLYLCKECQIKGRVNDIEAITERYNLKVNFDTTMKPVIEKEESPPKIPILSRDNFEIRYSMVDSLQKLELAQKAIMKESVVGLDTESLPVQIFHPSRAPQPVQIFQIGTRNTAYLFDLKAREILQQFFIFLSRLFDDSRIIKVGMNFQIDLRDLRQQYPVGKWNTQCFFQIRNFLELMNLKPLLKNTPPKAEPYGKKETGLEKIFRHVVGIGLDKTQCISNWARRPLSEPQINYAAIDVICEVMIFESLMKQGLKQLPDLVSDYVYNGL